MDRINVAYIIFSRCCLHELATKKAPAIHFVLHSPYTKNNKLFVASYRVVRITIVTVTLSQLLFPWQHTVRQRTLARLAVHVKHVDPLIKGYLMAVTT